MSNKLKRSEGAIIRKKNSRRLYVKTYFYRKSFEYSTGVDDSPENRAKISAFLKNVMDDHYAGELNFNSAFPGARPDKKMWYATQCSRFQDLRPRDVLVAPLIKEMKETFIPQMTNKSKQKDYLNAINSRVLSFFENNMLSFAEIDLVCMQRLAQSLYKKNGDPLTSSRISKIIIAIRFVMKFAQSRYNWNPLQDHFWALKMIVEVAEAKDSTRVLLYDEFRKILSALDEIAPWYRPIVELMVLTGMIPSEIAGLKPKAIKGNLIFVETFIVDNTEKKHGKTEFRKRKIPITDSIRRVLDELTGRQSSGNIVTMENGNAFNADKFRKAVWTPALLKAGVEYEMPYCLRHTFIGWALLAGMDPYVLSGLAGHNTTRMIYEVYGVYTDGLKYDKARIIDYLGTDFVSDNKWSI